MHIDELNQTARRIKSDLDISMRDLLKVQTDLQSSHPDEAFRLALNNLNKKDFDVVVCGEVKQGKTSFINALLGKNLLPVEVKVATSQVFRISNTPDESYFLVFDDGTREPIMREEMASYGTETDDKLANDPLLRGRTLRWIEVNTPSAFLPENVHLLDTPGLGALYHSHALITHKYVAAADAVIFVKAGKDPLVDSEKNFLQNVFAVTSNVMFVQSKADQFGEEERKILATRNEELLNREFSQLAKRNFRFWPISSKNLIDAAQETDASYRDILKAASGFDEMLEGLTALIFRAVGYSGACVACHEAFRYYQSVATFAGEQRKMLTTADVAERQKLQQAKAEKQMAFTQQWGLNGSGLRKVNDEINQIIQSGQQVTQGLFVPGGSIRKTFISEIDALPNDVAIIANYGRQLPNRVLESVNQRWHDIGTDAQQKMGELFLRFRTQLESASQSDTVSGLLSEVNLNDSSTYNKVRNVFYGGSLGGSIAGVGAGLLALLGVIGTGGVGIFLIPAAGFVFGAFSGKADADRLKAESDKRVLASYVVTALGDIQAALVYPERTGTKSRMQSYFYKLKEKVTCACEKISERERQKLQDEMAELEKQSKMNVEETRNKLEDLTRLAERAEPIRAKLIKIRDELVSINQSLTF